ncbi:MAG: GNAT family N-acetyltransferase [Armatimonadota bacterium]
MMVSTLDTVELKSGEWMEIVRVVPPEPAWRDRILPLLAHKSQPWQWQMETAFDEGLPGATQYFYEGVVEGEIVGNIMTVESMDPPIGILGHVFTPEEHRRKGICSHLMEAVTEDFRARDGSAMFLHTGYDSAPYHIYASWGFEGYRDTGTMAWVREADFRKNQFEPRLVEPRETHWGDWPALEALAETDEGWHVRSCYLNQHGFGGFEGQYLQVRRGLMKDEIRDFRVLAAEDGAVMGFALLGRWSAFPGTPLVLDTFVHQNFTGDAVALVQAVDLPTDQQVLALSDSASEGRAEALEAVGFAREAVLPDAVIDDDGRLRDIVIFARG